jgi:hypothetical protein
MRLTFSRTNRSRLGGLEDRLWTSRGTFFWRLDVPEDGNDRGMFLPSLGRSALRRRRMIHYIAAGGTRQTRLRRRDRPAESGRSFVLRLLLAWAAVWIAFRFVACS